jgi:prophage regulatory protein
MSQKLLRMKDVMSRTGFSRSMIYQLIADGKFPQQIVITARCVCWNESEVNDWILQKIEAPRALIS